MSVTIMSRWTKRAYLRLCAEKRQKSNSGSKGLKVKFCHNYILNQNKMLMIEKTTKRMHRYNLC